MSSRSFPFHLSKGSKSCRRLLAGFTSTCLVNVRQMWETPFFKKCLFFIDASVFSFTSCIWFLKHIKSLFLYYIKIDLDRAALCWRMLVGVLAWVEVSGRKFIASGRVQFELLTIRSSQVVSLRVEVQRPSQGQGSDNLHEIWNMKETVLSAKHLRIYFVPLTGSYQNYSYWRPFFILFTKPTLLPQARWQMHE